MLYTLKLYSAVGQLYLTKIGRKKVVIIKKVLTMVKKKERKSLSIYNGIQFINEKNKKILPFAKIQMNLEGTLLSEINQTEKDKYSVISLLCRI